MIQLMAAFLFQLLPQDSGVQNWAEPGRCGTNVAYAMLQMCGVQVGYSDVASDIPTDPALGTNLEQIRSTMEKFGVTTEARRVSIGELPSVPTPFIVHIDTIDKNGGGHFVLVTNIVPLGDNAFQIEYIDGGRASLIRQSLDEFSSSFLGFILCRTDSRGRVDRRLVYLIIGGISGSLVGFGWHRLRS